MSGEASERSGNTAVALVAAGGVSAGSVSIEERRRRVAESLRVGNPGNNARELPARADPRQDCHIELDVDDIHPYEHNPRHVTNAKFAEIKESIRSCGIRNPLTVTRRPGEKHFIVEAGGNTRLRAIQALWAETRQVCFQKITVLFRPWCSESHVLTAHLIENEQRGEMTFWDKANGVVVLKTQLEAEQGRTLTLRQLEGELKAIGMSVNPATLSHYLFATDRLRSLGEAVTGLSGMDVKTMQPRLNVLKRYAQLRAPIAEATLYDTVFEPVFQEFADHYRQTLAFSASAVCEACEKALAEHLHESVTQVRMGLDAGANPPSALSEALNTPDCEEKRGRTGEGVTASGEAAADRNGAVDGPGDAPSDAATRHAPPDREPPVCSGLIREVRRFADLSGIGECLRLHPAARHGYFMQGLPKRDDDARPQGLKHRTWRLLALISGQLETTSVAPPDDSSGAPPPGAEVDCVGEESLQTILFDAEFLAWILDTHDEAAVAFWRIVTLVRELQASTAPDHARAERRPESTGST